MDNIKSKHTVTLDANFSNGLLRVMQEGLIVLNSSGYVIAAYKTAGKFFGGLDHHQLLGKHFSELY